MAAAAVAAEAGHAAGEAHALQGCAPLRSRLAHLQAHVHLLTTLHLKGALAGLRKGHNGGGGVKGRAGWLVRRLRGRNSCRAAVPQPPRLALSGFTTNVAPGTFSVTSFSSSAALQSLCKGKAGRGSGGGGVLRERRRRAAGERHWCVACSSLQPRQPRTAS